MTTQTNMLILMFIFIFTQSGDLKAEDAGIVRDQHTDNSGLERGDTRTTDAEAHMYKEDPQSASVWHQDWYTDRLPDRPLQLVQPDPQHKKLIVVEDNFKLLRKIEGNVATIAVVGKFHSGKSFLLNQLMGKSTGFGIGPSVRPQTMGIWMWGKPLEMVLESGQKVSLIFLDTEGFAATNVSESYDAKVFAVSTLLSSFLIYNSVKIIDQSDIDYLELLARRTQVVQDFAQLTEDGETPQQWLHRLMATRTREKEDYEISLLGMFKSVDCHTMFFPATKRELLVDLSKAREEDLTPEYRQERDALIKTLKKGLQPKEKNDKPITGPELAALLEILVSAANEGSLASIPSRWDSFIERLQNGAKEDCLLFYEGEMNHLHKEHDMGPINLMEHKAWHEQAFARAMKLLQQLLFGLGDVVKDASTALRLDIVAKFSKLQEINEKRIKLKCAELSQRLVLEADEKFSALVLPMKTSLLENQIEAVVVNLMTVYEEKIGPLLSKDSLEGYLEILKKSVYHVGEGALLKNKKAMEATLEQSLKVALDQFHQRTFNRERQPRTAENFDQLISQSKQEAVQIFEKEADMASGEVQFTAFLGLLKSNIEETTQSLKTENEELLSVQVHLRVKDMLSGFHSRTDNRNMPLPMNDTDVERKLAHETELTVKHFQDDFSSFTSSDSFKEGLEMLQSGIQELCEHRKQENVEAFAREVKRPLHKAKQMIQLSADKYDTVFSLTQYVRLVCLLNLDDGKPRHWPNELKASIIDHFVTTDSDIQHMLHSRSGIWSSIVGFFQWLMWLIRGAEHSKVQSL